MPELTFGYEEAIGYCVAPEVVRDKDGISTSLLVATVVRRELAAGRTLLDVLDDLDRADGVHLTAPVTVRVEDLAVIPATMARLRAEPPMHLGGSAVTSVEDLADGLDGLPPPTVCGSGPPTGRGSSSARAAPNPSSSATARSSPTSRTGRPGGVRRAARERLDAVLADVRTVTA